MREICPAASVPLPHCMHLTPYPAGLPPRTTFEAVCCHCGSTASGYDEMEVLGHGPHAPRSREPVMLRDVLGPIIHGGMAKGEGS